MRVSVLEVIAFGFHGAERCPSEAVEFEDVEATVGTHGLKDV